MPKYALAGLFLFCRECGKEIEKGVKFCPYCGIGLSIDRNAVNEDSGDPVLIPGSKYVCWILAFFVIPLQIFMTV